MIKSIPYLEKVAMRDEMFFLGNDTPELLQALNIKKIWNNISPDTKNAIWKYIQSFFTIGIKVIEMPPDTHDILNYIINYKN